MNIMELEKLRKKQLFKFSVSIVIFILFIFIFILYLSEIGIMPKYIDSNIVMFIPIISVIILGGTVTYITRIVKGFENTVKFYSIDYFIENILNGRGEIKWNKQDNSKFTLDRLLFDTGKTTQEIAHLEELLRASKFFKFDRCITDDTFYGKYKGTEVFILETELESGYGKHRSTTFKGVILLLTSNHKFPDFSGITITNTNQYLNNASLMQLRNKVKIYCLDNTVLVACDFINWLGLSKDLFKLGCLFKKVDDTKQYMTFAQEFELVLSLIDSLKENPKFGL